MRWWSILLLFILNSIIIRKINVHWSGQHFNDMTQHGIHQSLGSARGSVGVPWLNNALHLPHEGEECVCEACACLATLLDPTGKRNLPNPGRGNVLDWPGLQPLVRVFSGATWSSPPNRKTHRRAAGMEYNSTTILGCTAYCSNNNNNMVAY